MESTLRVSIDDETKQKAMALFGSMGLDISTAIRMFLKQSIESGCQPFQFRITERDINGFSLFDAERIAMAKKQLDAGKGRLHDLIEAD